MSKDAKLQADYRTPFEKLDQELIAMGGTRPLGINVEIPYKVDPHEAADRLIEHLSQRAAIMASASLPIVAVKSVNELASRLSYRVSNILCYWMHPATFQHMVASPNYALEFITARTLLGSKVKLEPRLPVNRILAVEPGWFEFANTDMFHVVQRAPDHLLIDHSMLNFPIETSWVIRDRTIISPVTERIMQFEMRDEK